MFCFVFIVGFCLFLLWDLKVFCVVLCWFVVLPDAHWEVFISDSLMVLLFAGPHRE